MHYQTAPRHSFCVFYFKVWHLLRKAVALLTYLMWIISAQTMLILRNLVSSTSEGKANSVIIRGSFCVYDIVLNCTCLPDENRQQK